ncbi:TonB-dependent siderophore receptor [Burkholderia gladioli]|uniref:TonB-dependent siderophore receptor n=1 Tax=Burkholderia gladioli TaxID=28095 RepID=UPI001F154423|nr:TonB-dependent siderophore receptor [Burkholderia gladioli]
MPTNRPSRRRMAARRPLHATALTLALAGAAHTSAASAADASGTAAPAAPAIAASSAAPATEAAAAHTLPTVSVRGAAAAEPTVGYQPRTTSITGFPNQSVMKVPQAVAVVSSTVIEDQHARSLDDVLSNVSGIVQTNTLGGTRDAFIKRGFGNNDDGSILVDGMRSPVLHNYLAAIDRVEVLKGPTSLLYGVQEPGGVINLITRKPEDEYSGSISASKTNHGGAGGSFDLTGPIGGVGQVAGGTLAFRLTGEDNTSQYWRTFGRERDSLIAPALSWHDARTSIEIRYQYADYTTPFDRGTVLVNGRLDDALASRRYEEAWAQSSGIQEMFQAKVEHQLSDNWRVRAAYSWGRDRYGQYITRATAFNSATGALTRTADANLGRNDSNQIASIGLLGKLTLGGIRNDLYFGTEYERRREFRGDTIRGTATKGFTIFDPVYGLLPPGVVPSATQSDNLWKTHTYSFMAQDNVHLSERLTAVAGIRLENWQQFAGQGRPFVVADDSHGHVWLPTLGLVYALTPGLSAYVNTSRSFVPNSSVDGLAPLPPTTGRSVETGLKFELNHSVTGTLALYQIDKRNVAVTVNGVSQTIGAARSRGVELDLAGQITRHWSVIGSYAYTDAIDRQANVPLVNAARHTGSLFAVYDTSIASLPGQWRFGAGAHFVGRRAGDTANSFTLPGYALVDAFAAYETRIGKFPTKVQLNVNNLFNKVYYPSSNSNLIIAVGEPRLVTLTTTVSF